MGQVFRLLYIPSRTGYGSLNPRFVGQVFRLMGMKMEQSLLRVLIPDLWGKSSDDNMCDAADEYDVLIPDLWGKSSDVTGLGNRWS